MTVSLDLPRDEPRLDSSALLRHFEQVRRQTMSIVEPLTPEDCVVQSMPDVSPTKWHLAHTTWFFETFILEAHQPGYRSRWPEHRYLFNSYYNAVGERHPRQQRGLLTRPSLNQVVDYRIEIDRLLTRFLEEDPPQAVWELVELGCHHEQQHQELALMDIKHVFSCNPLRPAWCDETPSSRQQTSPPLDWVAGHSGMCRIGHDGDGFCFDNETPVWETLLTPHELASRLVTCGEYLEFINDGGYRNPRLWFSDGWDVVSREGWQAPLYWDLTDSGWKIFTLRGEQPLDVHQPVCHVSYYEADAFARWSGSRLPTETEWEQCARTVPLRGNYLEEGAFHPRPANNDHPGQMFGDVWEWTASPYIAYPGYRPAEGAIGEYNGKFMCNQMVLRGGCCVTPRDHIRPTYRNFFHPEKRWPFTGIRLAR